MFSFPKQYGDTNTGITLSKDELREVAEVSGIMDGNGCSKLVQTSQNNKPVRMSQLDELV